MHHDRKSSRLPEYDYSSPGAYLVTICLFPKSKLLGEVSPDGVMKLNRYGKIVEEEWLRTAELRTNVELDEFVIMPDHFHGLVVLRLGTVHRAPTPESFSIPTSSSLPTMIRYFKAAVTRRIRELSGNQEENIWQRSYHEHVIRKNENINAAREYILNNPLRWSLHKKNSSYQ